MIRRDNCTNLNVSLQVKQRVVDEKEKAAEETSKEQASLEKIQVAALATENAARVAEGRAALVHWRQVGTEYDLPAPADAEMTPEVQ